MKLNIEEMRREPLTKERLAYNSKTGNRIDVEVYLHPLRAMYKVGKEGNDTANIFDNLKAAVDKFNYLEDSESGGKKFKHGDRVFHKNLEQYGIFISYAWESDEECDVEFIDDDGYVEQKHVSINQLKLAN